MVRRRRRRMRKRSATVVPSSVREGSGPFIAFASVGIGVNEADKQRAQEDVEVEWHGPVLAIVEVVLHTVLHLFDIVRQIRIDQCREGVCQYVKISAVSVS